MLNSQQISLPIFVGISLLTTTSLLYYLYVKNQKKFVNVCKINKLFIYPIKAAKGVEVDHLEVTKYGVKYKELRDRSWILLDKNNYYLQLKDEPRLALTQCSIEGQELWVNAPNMPTLKLRYIKHLNKDHQLVMFKMYNQEMKGINCGPEVNQWFELYFGRPGVRLIQHHPDLNYRTSNSHKRSTEDHKYPVIFQNKSTLHLVNERSIDDLNTYISTGAESLKQENFRPNILISYPEAWAEDQWKWMQINRALFKRYLLCNRCPNITVNQDTGVKDMESLIALNKFRPPTGINKKKGCGPNFGVIFGYISSGIIHVGNDVDVMYASDNKSRQYIPVIANVWYRLYTRQR
ncbi:mitochondrial amidoxime reducing component 2-like [Oppia nitens]|uniref:mitochondrial amidoxime reducing component 2-like n=1 Tax=Oppia nitens TaxID=1686743 RepID=UPI0023DB9333|nr:mitochondrial amidoxime reducing component 2-like [Oppia nitens]